MFRQNMNNIKSKNESYYEKIMSEDPKVTMEDVNECIMNLMK